jgi:hypothetical protein
LGSLAQCNYYEGKTGWSSYLKLGQWKFIKKITDSLLFFCKFRAYAP